MRKPLRVQNQHCEQSSAAGGHTNCWGHTSFCRVATSTLFFVLRGSGCANPSPVRKDSCRKGLRLGRLRCHTATHCKVVEGVPSGQTDTMAVRCPEHSCNRPGKRDSGPGRPG